MRKRISGKKLSRSPSHRLSLYRNLVQSLFERGKIVTTLAKAKAIRPEAEKLITQAKKGNLAVRRKAAAYLYKDAVVKKLVSKISPLYKERPGGYTRILHLGPRKSDAAEMAILELVQESKRADSAPEAAESV